MEVSGGKRGPPIARCRLLAPAPLAYVLGWSLADGTYPIITLLALRLAAGCIPRLAVRGFSQP